MLHTFAFYLPKNVNRVKIDPRCADVCAFLSMLMRVNETESFKIVEHAWFWKMASELEQHDFAARIKDVEHAGKV